MRISPSPVVVPNRPQPPRFGYIPAPLLLKSMDFVSLGVSTVEHNMLIYGSVIGSRLWKSRSPNELSENARRDVLGWYNWFMGSPLIQIMVVSLLPAASLQKSLLLNSPGKNMPFFKKIGTALLMPHKVWTITSDVVLHQQMNHLRTAMVAHKESPKVITEMLGRFHKARNYRALLSAFGLAYTFFALGVGINMLNIALTKASLRRKQLQNPNASPAHRFQGQPAFRPQPAGSHH